jgi:hypothetical protein
MLIIAVGYQCWFNSILTIIKEVEITPLEHKLRHITTKLGKVGIFSVLLTVLILYFRLFIQSFLDRSMSLGEESESHDNSIGYYLKEIIRYTIIGLSIMLAIPEGLSLAAIIASSYSYK